jgi:hypothetical protein
MRICRERGAAPGIMKAQGIRCQPEPVFAVTLTGIRCAIVWGTITHSRNGRIEGKFLDAPPRPVRFRSTGRASDGFLGPPTASGMRICCERDGASPGGPIHT